MAVGRGGAHPKLGALPLAGARRSVGGNWHRRRRCLPNLLEALAEREDRRQGSQGGIALARRGAARLSGRLGELRVRPCAALCMMSEADA